MIIFSKVIFLMQILLLIERKKKALESLVQEPGVKKKLSVIDTYITDTA